MIIGHKPSAYMISGDGTSRVTADLRQCIHCQYSWVYKPGSGIRRGYCLYHDGWLCGRPECTSQQKRFLAQYLTLTGRTMRLNGAPIHCLAFDEINELRLEKTARQLGTAGRDFTISESGLILPLEEHA